MDKSTVSIQRQYIIVALFLGSIIIGASVYGYFDTLKHSNRLVLQVNKIAELLTRSTQIRNHFAAGNRAIDNFMLEPDRSEQKEVLKKELLNASNIVLKFKTDSTIRKLDVSTILDDILDKITLLDNTAKQLFQIRTNANAQYPALQVSANIMRPRRNEIFSIFSIALNEYKDENNNNDSDAYELLTLGQNLWISTISEYRLYLANRIGSFNENRLREQEINVESYIARIEDISAKLQSHNNNWAFGFEGSELIQKLPEAIDLWKKGYLQVKKINRSKRWRQDTHLMKESIVPLLQNLNDLLVALNEKIKIENERALKQLSRSGMNQSIVLAGVILLFLLYIFVSLLLLKRFIINPITLIARSLKNEAFGKPQIHTLNIKKTKETQDLIDAFNEMSHQVYQRQQDLEFQALNDNLTSLPNRLKLQERLKYHIKIAKREKTNFVFMMLDLNQFKEVNDTLGHHRV